MAGGVGQGGDSAAGADALAGAAGGAVTRPGTLEAAATEKVASGVDVARSARGWGSDASGGTGLGLGVGLARTSAGSGSNTFPPVFAEEASSWPALPPQQQQQQQHQQQQHSPLPQKNTAQHTLPYTQTPRRGFPRNSQAPLQHLNSSPHFNSPSHSTNNSIGRGRGKGHRGKGAGRGSRGGRGGRGAGTGCDRSPAGITRSQRVAIAGAGGGLVSNTARTTAAEATATHSGGGQTLL